MSSGIEEELAQLREAALLKKQKKEEEARIKLEQEAKDAAEKETPKSNSHGEFIEDDEAPAGTLRKELFALMAEGENPPTVETINKWRAEYGKGNLHLVGFGYGHVYIFKPLTLSVWRSIREMGGAQQELGHKDVEGFMKEKVAQQCVLWPQMKKNHFETAHAGVLENLYNVIMLNSYMLTPQQAMALTIEL